MCIHVLTCIPVFPRIEASLNRGQPRLNAGGGAFSVNYVLKATSQIDARFTMNNNYCATPHEQELIKDRLVLEAGTKILLKGIEALGLYSRKYGMCSARTCMWSAGQIHVHVVGWMSDTGHQDGGVPVYDQFLSALNYLRANPVAQLFTGESVTEGMIDDQPFINTSQFGAFPVQVEGSN